MDRFEIDTDCEGSDAEFSQNEDRLVIDTSFEASESGELDQDDQINEDECDLVVSWKNDADHESEELESPASPDFDADDECEEIDQVHPNLVDDSGDSDIYRSDDDFYDAKENINPEDKDGVDDNSEIDKLEARAKGLLKGEVEIGIEPNWDSPDEKESVKEERRLKLFSEGARKNANASLQEERLNAVDVLLATKSSRIRKKERKRTMVDELLTGAEFQHKSKQKYKEIVGENQQYNSRAHRYSKRVKRKSNK
ncbi:osteopontin-like [Cloeon dipterum]|uniref:osteopontin-like n=1 Tax=Cloeon dipterum TaxID=197152 RepID=UPI0032202750